MQGSIVSQQTEGAVRERSRRLYYLDWLRIIATLGVFLFHVFDIFNGRFRDQKRRKSDVIMMIEGFFYPWGMPLFFVIAGAGSWFALRRRTAGQFTRERTLRLLVPFFTGTLLLGPIQVYLSWRHRTETGVFTGTLGEFARIACRIRPQAFRGDRVPYVVSRLSVRLLVVCSPPFRLVQGGCRPPLRRTPGSPVRASRRHPDLHPPAHRGAAAPSSLSPLNTTGPTSSCTACFSSWVT